MSSLPFLGSPELLIQLPEGNNHRYALQDLEADAPRYGFRNKVPVGKAQYNLSLALGVITSVNITRLLILCKVAREEPGDGVFVCSDCPGVPLPLDVSSLQLVQIDYYDRSDGTIRARVRCGSSPVAQDLRSSGSMPPRRASAGNFMPLVPDIGDPRMG